MLDQLVKELFGKGLPKLDITVAAAPKASDVPPKMTVESFDNHIYFYSDVDTDRCLALIRTLRETDSRLRNEQTTRSLPEGFPPQPIWLHIQSGGGDLFAGLAMIEQLKAISSPIYSVIEGYCASAATLLSMSCSKRYIQLNSYMLIHQFTSFFYGTHEKFKDEHRLQSMLIERMVAFYTGHSKLDAPTIREMLKHDSWMDSAEAVGKGFVDALWGESESNQL